jgi:hypothetical protein
MGSSRKDRAEKGSQDYSDIFGTVDFPLKQHVSPHGRVSAVSMMKDEGPFVLEWVAHHLALGFTDLVVYTNDCSDGTDDMLIRLEELGLAHHRRNDIPEGRRPQPSALKHAQKEPVVRGSDWVLVFDADEFLCIRQGDGTMDGLISETKALGGSGVVITWRTYGSGGVHEWSRAPVSEQYLYAAPQMWNKGWGVKTLFQFDPDYWVLGIHRPKMKNKHLETGFPDTVQWLNGSGRPMEDYFKFRGWRSIVRTVGYDWVQMNHYAVKSIDSYALRKLRGNVNNKKDKYNSDYWALQDRNEVYDDAILRHADKRRDIFETLLTDRVLRRLHNTAVEAAEERLRGFKETPAYAELVAGVKEASKIPITEVVAKPPKKRDAAKIAALMLDVEKKRNAKPKEERRHAAHSDWGRDGDPYVRGEIDLSGSPSIAVFENRGLKVPADPRVFSPVTLQQIMDGKLERNTARNLPRLVVPGSCYLEVGAGVGFLAAVIARECPGAKVVAQEENMKLRMFGSAVWKMNGIATGPNLAQSEMAMFGPQDDRLTASGLDTLMAVCTPAVLNLNEPRVSAEMLAGSLERHTGALPKYVLVGARALAGQFVAERGAALLTERGYATPEESPFATAMFFELRARFETS